MHKKKTFQFVDSNGTPVELESVDWTFEIEEILTNRFGKDVFQKLNSGERFEFDLKLNDIEEDFPLLLANSENISWKKQDYDNCLRVYHFFLTYKRNAWLRQLDYEGKTTVSILRNAMEQMEKILESTSKKSS